MTDLDRAPGAATEISPPWWGRMVAGAERLVFDVPLWAMLLLVAALTFVKNGVTEASSIPLWLRITAAFPGNPHLPKSVRYMQGSPIGPALAHVLGVHTSRQYAALHLGVLVVALVVLVVGLWRVGGRLAVGVGVVAFFATPLSNVLITLGAQDPFTFLFASLLVLARSPLLALVAGVGLGASHLEVGAFAVVAVAALRVVDDTAEQPLIATVCSVLGLLGGAAGVELYTHHSGAGTEARASYIGQIGVKALVEDFLRELPTWLYTTFSAFWVFLAALGSRVRNRRLVVVAVVAVTLCTVAVILTYDETRVFALLTWPLVLWSALYALRRFPAELVRRVTAVTFLAAVVLPRITVFGGHVYGSTLGFLLGKLFAHL